MCEVQDAMSEVQCSKYKVQCSRIDVQRSSLGCHGNSGPKLITLLVWIMVRGKWESRSKKF